MTNSKTTSTKSLTAPKAEALNMPTRYKYEGANNLFARGEAPYAPNEIASLELPEQLRKVMANSPVWNAPFVAPGAMVRVVMVKRAPGDRFVARVFPIGANLRDREYMCELMLADVAAGMDRRVACVRHLVKGLEIDTAYLGKLPPQQAYDEVYRDTQRQIALGSEASDRRSARGAIRFDFANIIQSLYLAMDGQFSANGADLMGALPSREAKRFLEEARATVGTPKAAAVRTVAPRERAKLLGKPVWSMLAEDELDARGRALAIATESGPMAGIKNGAVLRMPSDEAIAEVIENMRDVGAFGVKPTSQYHIENGYIRSVGSATHFVPLMQYIAKLAAIVNDPDGWEEFRDRWMEEAKLRDPDISYTKLAEVMLWPDIRVVNEVDMSITQEVMG
ncbi:hypothetical protein [Stenotrophomonas phage vB_SmaS_BUCT548]|uniref:Uncharacterized protein n=1 Tax=Stenotrophomonas phage vB_SmaS_BUCT548 TaxID=2712941 RepID=A0A7D2LNR6_9CAUD|nr:hypothetical protein PQD75_gp068 [Stenotrophomonas phage vB_SmaS_BUCT548]QIQ60804.1 hypothetical protein [Stenotrophomonas phage vB_SmaS_BUCT548]